MTFSDSMTLAVVGDRLHAELGVNFIALSEADNRLPPTPVMLLGDISAKTMRSYYSRHHIWQQGVYSVENATLLGAWGVIAGGGEWLSFPRANIHELYTRRIAAEHPHAASDLREIRIEEPVALIAGPGYRVYGHWLSDFLPKLFLLARAGFDLKTLKIALPADTPGFGSTWLRLMGIPDSSIIRFDTQTEKLRCASLLVPTTLHNGVRCAPILREASRFLTERLNLADSPSLTGRRLFLSRARASQSRSITNREAIEAHFAERGFDIVAPETLPIPDQIQLIRSASFIAGEYGSALHASLFCPPGLTVLALRGNGIHPEFIQSGIGEVLGHPTGYILGRDRTEDSGFDLEPDLVEVGLRAMMSSFGRQA